MNNSKPCSVEGCTRVSRYARPVRLCEKHRGEWRRAGLIPASKPLAPPVIRFESTLALGSGGCWLWTGSKSNARSGGYGVFNPTGKPNESVLAHRWSYEYHRCEIPLSLELDHLCRVRDCVNPWHLEPVTHAENMRRMSEAITHCKSGHEFTPENTHIRFASGNRTCRTCQQRWDKESYARKLARLAG